MQNMKKIKEILAFISVVILAVCAVVLFGEGNSEKIAAYTVPEYNISFDMPESWQESPGSGDFSFVNGAIYFSGYVHTDADLLGDDTREDLFNDYTNQIKQARGVRESAEDIMFENVPRDTDGKKITTTLFEGNKDGERFSYYVACIEFDGSDKFIWSIFSAPADVVSGDVTAWDEILNSAKNLG